MLPNTRCSAEHSQGEGRWSHFPTLRIAGTQAPRPATDPQLTSLTNARTRIFRVFRLAPNPSVSGRMTERLFDRTGSGSLPVTRPSVTRVGIEPTTY